MQGSKESLRLLNSTTSALEDPEKESSKRPWFKHLKAILIAFVIPVSHIIGATAVQLLERRIPDFELQAFRSSAIILFALSWMLCHLQSPKVPLPEIFATVLYAFISTLSSSAIYVSFALTSVTAVQCSNSTVNLLSGLLIFGFCGKEHIGHTKVVFAFLCIVGVVLVVQPWHTQVVKKGDISMNVGVTSNCSSLVEELCNFKLTKNNTEHSDLCDNQPELLAYLYQKTDNCDHHVSAVVNQTHFDTSELCYNLSMCGLASIDTSNKTILDPKMNTPEDAKFLLFHIPPGFLTTIGVVIAGFAGLMLTLLTFIVKQNPCLNDHRVRSLLWAFIVCLVCSLLLTFLVENPVWPHTLFDIIAVAIHCLASVSTWFLFMYSAKHVSGTLLNILVSSAVVLFLIPQYTILASIYPGHRNWVEVTGVLMVLLGTISGSLYELLCTKEENGT